MFYLIQWQVTERTMTKESEEQFGGLVCVEGVPMTKVLRGLLPKIRSLDVRPDDIWVITFPKTGTTWVQEMIWLLKNNFDTGLSTKIDLLQRFNFLELESMNPFPDLEQNTIRQFEEMPSPRLVKSHLPLRFLPKQLAEVKPKIICTFRDPRDVVISFYHHNNIWKRGPKTLDEFVDSFVNGKEMYGDFWAHVLEYWQMKETLDILFLCYEDMLKDTRSSLNQIGDFIGVKVSDENWELVRHHLSFEGMKANPSLNLERATKGKANFFREGKAGTWKSVLTAEQTRKLKEWTDSKLQGTKFPFYKP